MIKEKWTESQIAILNDNLEQLSYREIGALIGKSKSAVSQYCFQHGKRRSEQAHKRIKKRTNTTMFKKGQKPWNNGTKGLVKPNATTFQKGNRPSHTYSEFSISYKENKNGSTYKIIKIGNSWQRLHRYNWEQLFGPIPKGNVIVFRDGDSLNCEPENLECITKAEKMRREQQVKVKRAEARKLLEKELSERRDPNQKKVKPVKREVITTNEIPLQLSPKITIMVKPGQDIEAIKKKYSYLIN